MSRVVKICCLLFLVLVSAANAQSDGTARGALKLLPKDAAKRLARIEARGGTPAPERWYLLVYDPDVPRGLREFVVAAGRVVANRTISQFSDGLKPADVVGADSVNVDSDQTSRLAATFAAENGRLVGSLDYELGKNSQEPGTAWRVTVLDPAGDQIGVLVLMAANGRMMSHDGFEKEPALERLNAALGPARLALPAQTRGGDSRNAGQARPATPRMAAPSTRQKPSLLKRIFGAIEEKPRTAPQ